jgi:hypothetical protein
MQPFLALITPVSSSEPPTGGPPPRPWGPINYPDQGLPGPQPGQPPRPWGPINYPDQGLPGNQPFGAVVVSATIPMPASLDRNRVGLCARRTRSTTRRSFGTRRTRLIPSPIPAIPTIPKAGKRAGLRSSSGKRLGRPAPGGSWSVFRLFRIRFRLTKGRSEEVSK